MKKTLFTLFLALAASVGTLFAESGTCGENLTWDLKDGVLTISGIGVMYDFGYRDVPWYLYRSSITEVSIGNSVTSIGDYAFYGCTGLMNVTIPNSVTTIGNSAFEGCSGLTSITIPNSVTTIGNSAFEYCSGLTSITIPKNVTSIGDGAFYFCSNLISVTWNAKNYTESIMSWGSYVEFFSFGNEVEYIPAGCCSGLNKLTSITIPNSVTIIGRYAFSECTGLTSIEIPNSVTCIKERAFSGCVGLTSITIPNSVTSIEDAVCDGCTNLTSIVWEAKNCATPSSGFYFPFSFIYSQITSFTFGENVETIPRYLCYGMSQLTSITIPNSVTSIGYNAFEGCNNLSIIYNHAEIPQQITEGVFGDVNKSTCLLLVPAESYGLYKSAPVWKDFLIDTTSVCIAGYGMCGDGLGWIVSCDSSVLTIMGIGDMTANWELNEAPWYPFRDSIEYIFLPKGITSIGDYAFSGCSNVKEITCKALTPPICGTAVFRDIDKTITLHLPDASIDLYKIANQWEDFFPHEEPTPCITAYGKCGDDLVWKINCNTSELEIIGSGDMYNYDWNTSPWYNYRTLFKKIHLSEELNSIGTYAFFGCIGLTSISIPNTVTSIGDGAFFNCTSLDTICNNATTPQPISKSVFYGIDRSACLLIVPEESVPLYKAAPVWKCFLFEDGTLIKPSYEDCELELIGDAIANQEGAIPDPSDWQWGNVYPLGTPVRDGNLYTWQASLVHITTTSYGFKIRTKNGQPSGEMDNFDYGQGGKFGDNLTVSEDALYDITFTFNSDTEEMTYSCVKHASTPLSNIEEDSYRTHTRKLLHNGQIYILHGEKTYTLTGQDIVLK